MPYIGEICALSAALLWSFSSFLFTAAANRLGTIVLNINRLLFAVVLLFITISIAGLNWDISRDQVIYFSLSGLIGLVLGDSFLFKAFREIGPRISMLIMSSNPAIAAILAYLILGEKLSFIGITGIFVTLSGISLVVLEKRNEEEKAKFRITAMGVTWAFLGAAGQGIGLIFAKMAFNTGPVNELVATFVRLISSVIIMLPAAMIIRKYPNPLKNFLNDKKIVGIVFLASIIGPYLGITLSLISIIHTKVGIASTLMSTVPIIMLPLSVFIHKEKLSWRAIAGAVIAVGGVVVLIWQPAL